MSDWDYTEETSPGHHVSARLQEKSHLRKRLDSIAEDLEVEPLCTSPMVEIEVGDVDWDEPKTVQVRFDTLRAITGLLEDINNE